MKAKHETRADHFNRDRHQRWIRDVLNYGSALPLGQDRSACADSAGQARTQGMRLLVRLHYSLRRPSRRSHQAHRIAAKASGAQGDCD
jgi:hypothetical protein